MPRIIYVLLVLGVAVGAFGCDSCKKISRARTIVAKDSAAYCYYDKRQYESSALLFEELMGIYPPGAKSEKTLFFLANSKFFSGQMITAGYLYNQFIQRYPSSDRAPDAYYQLAMSFVEQSQPWYLDQAETRKAIERLQLFIELYPTDKRVPEATAELDGMLDKLAEKLFEQADLYLRIYRYKSAVHYFNLVLQEYPSSRFREVSFFKLFQAQIKYADNSVITKRLERYEKAEEYYLKFVDKFPESKYIRSAEKLFASLQNRLTAAKAGDEATLKELRKEKKKDEVAVEKEKKTSKQEKKPAEKHKKEKKKKKKDGDQG